MLAEYLAADWYSRDETLWEGVYRLIAAHCLECRDGALKVRQYWEPDIWSEQAYAGDDEYVEHYRELFLDNVRRHSRAKESVSIEVSGGLDSSAVLCAAAHLQQLDNLPSPGVEAYSLAFDDNTATNELRFCRAVGDILGMDIHEIPPDDMPVSWYEEQARVYRTTPDYPTVAIFTGMLEGIASTGSRVLLTGLGGDEWLGGSRDYYAEELLRCRWKSLIGCARSDIHELGFQRTSYWFLRHGVFPLLPVQLQKGLKKIRHSSGKKSTAERNCWLSPKLQELIRLRRATFHSQPVPAVRHPGQLHLLEMLHHAFKSYPIESSEVRAARVGIERRHPMDDARIVQFAVSTPARLFLKGRRRKWIHTQALQDLMPQLVLKRRSKAEFSSVVARVIAKMERDLSDTVSYARTEWVKPNEIRLLDDECSNSESPGRSLRVLFGLFGCDRLFPYD